MLVLSRKKLERVVLDISELVPGAKPMEVLVTEIRGDKVRLAFDADKRIKIVRAELCESTEKEPSAIGA